MKFFVQRLQTDSRGIAVLLVACLVSFAAVGAAQQKATAPERALFDSANAERKAHGLPTLKWDDALATAARKHALAMAQQGSVSHQVSGEPSLPARAKQAGARFTWLSENVAEGPNASDVHEKFMKSPTHRANLLDADMDSVGIGVAERNGQLFVAEDFSKAR
jgi:uncharacterized protein YkwD